jgi:hypothetical protein
LSPIAAKAGSEIASAVEAVFNTAQGASGAAAAPNAPVLRTLTIELAPPDTGRIVVRMKLDRGALSVTLEASPSSAAQALVNDRDKLERMLAAKGYAIDQVAIQIAPTTPLVPIGPAPHHASPQAAPTFDPGGGSQGQSHARDTGQSGSDDQDPPFAKVSPASRSDRGIYL